MKTLMAIIIAHAMTITAVTTGLASPSGVRSKNIITQSTLSEFPDFLGDNGKGFRGRALAYNPDNETVTIAKENGKTFKVDLNTLSKDDRNYIREWHLIKEFFTQIHCQISPTKKRSEVGTELLIWRPGEEIVYNIILENRSGYGLNDLTVDYCIYYELDRPGNRGQVVSQGVKRGTLDIGTFAVGAEVQVKTQPLVLPKGKLCEYYKDNKMPAVKTLGIWIRIYLPLPEKRRAMREFARPNSIMKTRKWVSSDLPDHPPSF